MTTEPFRLNADLNQRCTVHSPSLDWVDSPAAGVSRRMLERDGGEEMLVLDGTLHDEHGSYGPGTYIKNPVGSSHAPFTVDGCTLFVKLRHLDLRDDERVVIDTRRSEWRQGLVDGLKVCFRMSMATTRRAAGCAART